MPRFMLIVNYDPGAVSTPMAEWAPEDIQAHMDYYRVLTEQIIASGEQVDDQVLTFPDRASIVTSDGKSAPVVTDGPFSEFKEFLAGFKVVDVESRERAIEIAAALSAVPGPGGIPTQQPIQVRQILSAAEAGQLSQDEMLDQLL